MNERYPQKRIFSFRDYLLVIMKRNEILCLGRRVDSRHFSPHYREGILSGGLLVPFFPVVVGEENLDLCDFPVLVDMKFPLWYCVD